MMKSKLQQHQFNGLRTNTQQQLQVWVTKLYCTHQVKLIQFHADTVNAVKLAQADAIHFTSETSASAKKTAKKNVLPQMGDENSNKTVWSEISLAMAGVLATLGLADQKTA